MKSCESLGIAVAASKGGAKSVIEAPTVLLRNLSSMSMVKMGAKERRSSRPIEYGRSAPDMAREPIGE